MKADRFFYTLAGGVFLLLMLVGFRAFYTHSTGLAGRRIDPVIFTVVLVHGLAIAAWFVLFFVQALLISVRNRRLHMKLGWGVVGIGLAITCTGTLVAIRSVQVSPPIHFFGMEYARFLLVMLTEIASFTIFVAVGVLARRKPKIHRPMMLLASLTLLGRHRTHPLFLSALWHHRLDRPLRCRLLPRSSAAPLPLPAHAQLRSLVRRGLCRLGLRLHRFNPARPDRHVEPTRRPDPQTLVARSHRNFRQPTYLGRISNRYIVWSGFPPEPVNASQ